MKPIDQILSQLKQVHNQDNGWIACCPAHDDQTPSLSIREANDGKVLLNCFAGCKTESIVAALDLTMADLMPDRLPTGSSSIPTLQQTYNYQDEAGNLLFQVVRLKPKGFRQRRPDGQGGWHWKVKGVRVVPYRLPQLLASRSRVVFIVEGEKDVHSLESINCVAICNAGGALKWTKDHAVHLHGYKVVILPDNDEPGRQHAEQVAQSLEGIAETVKVVPLPGLAVKGDVSDWITAGGRKDELDALVQAAPPWEPNQQQWGKIESLDNRHLPYFPNNALPDVLSEFVEAESHFTQTPSDLTALLCLAVCGAVLAKKIRIEARTGFSEPTNLYVCVILDPGNRKSSVLADATRPLRELEKELVEQARPQVARLASERRQDEKRLAALEKRGIDDAEARQEAIDLAIELAESPVHELPRLLVDDATCEKLGMMLADQGGRIASFSAEGTVFDLMAGRYSKSGMPQMDVYLKGHNGDDLITDRVGRNTVQVSSPALTCGYTVQLDVIKRMSLIPSFRGRGLAARFCYAVPQSWIGSRQVACQAVPENVKYDYDQLVRRLFAFEGPFTIHLTQDAAQTFQCWEAEVERMLADGGDLEAMRDWGAKLHGATLRLAAILHCVDNSPQELVSQQCIDNAITISRYLISHAEAAFDAMSALEDSTTDGARYLIRWIENNDLQEFSRRDAHQHGRRKFKTVEELDAPLNELIVRGYIRPQPSRSDPSIPGRKPSPRYDVNPALFSNEVVARRTHNPQIDGQPPPTNHSEDSEYAIQATQTGERVQVTL